jgi:hypothetical protein
VNKAVIALIGLTFSSLSCAQDFLQQWRDSATKGMNEFRAAHRSAIEAGGWQFVGGTMTAEAIPRSDVFIKDVKALDGSVRSARVLEVSYVSVPAADVPEYQSTKALLWFDCSERRYEERGIARYPSVDASGDPSSLSPDKPASASLQGKPIEPESVEGMLLATACSAKP